MEKFNPLTYHLSCLLLGRSMTDSQALLHGGVTLKKLRRSHRRLRRIRAEFRKPSTSSRSLNYSRVTAPLALVSQIQRSGGTLLSQLFDGHPRLHAHPHELKTGYPKKTRWPRLHLNDTPTHWFELLFEDGVIEAARDGYRKDSSVRERLPFNFSAALQQRIFLDCIGTRAPAGLRDIYDAYFTAYFGAWLDNRNAGGDKRYVTAFTPRLAEEPADIDAFFRVYPDGRLISIVRDPLNWFPSAHRHETEKNKYADLGAALDQWLTSTAAMIRNRERYRQQVCLLRFEDLVGNREAVMHRLAAFLGIEYRPILLTPTFNGQPVTANSSFSAEKGGIMRNVSRRHRTLTREQREQIEHRTGPLYRRVLDLVEDFPQVPGHHPPVKHPEEPR